MNNQSESVDAPLTREDYTRWTVQVFIDAKYPEIAYLSIFKNGIINAVYSISVFQLVFLDEIYGRPFRSRPNNIFTVYYWDKVDRYAIQPWLNKHAGCIYSSQISTL